MRRKAFVSVLTLVVCAALVVAVAASAEPDNKNTSNVTWSCPDGEHVGVMVMPSFHMLGFWIDGTPNRIHSGKASGLVQVELVDGTVLGPFPYAEEYTFQGAASAAAGKLLGPCYASTTLTETFRVDNEMAGWIGEEYRNTLYTWTFWADLTNVLFMPQG